MFGLGSSNIGLGIAIHLKDKFTGPARRVGKEMEKMKLTANSVASAQLETVGYISAAVGAAGLATMGFFKNSISAYSDYEFTMKKVQYIIGGTISDMEALDKKASQVALSTIYTSKEVSGAYLELARAGASPKELENMIQHVANAAAATGTSINAVAEYGTDMMTSMNFSAKETAHVMDLLTVASNRSNTTFLQLAEAFKYTGYNLRSFNIPMTESLAVLGALANAGLKGSIAGTTLNNFLTRLVKSVTMFKTKRQASVLQLYGLEEGDIIDKRTGQLRSLVDIMDRLGVILKKRGAKDIPAFDALLGKRGGKAILAAFGDQRMGASLKELHALLSDPKVAGTAQRISEGIMGETTQGNILKMASAWEEFKKTIGKTIVPLLIPILKGVTWILKVMQAIASTPLGKAFVIAAAIITPIVTGVSLLAAGVALVLSTLVMWPATLGAFNSMLKQTVVLTNAVGLSSARAGAAGAAAQATSSTGRFTDLAMLLLGAGGIPGSGSKISGLRKLASMGKFGRYLFLGTKYFSKFLGVLIRIVPFLGRLAGAVLGFLGGPFTLLALGIATLALSIWDINEIWNGLKYGLGRLVHYLTYAVDAIAALFGAGTMESAERALDRREYTLRKSLGWIPVDQTTGQTMTQDNWLRKRYATEFASRDGVTTFKRDQSDAQDRFLQKHMNVDLFADGVYTQEEVRRQQREAYINKKMGKSRDINIFLDGEKKVSKKIDDVSWDSFFDD